MKTNLTESDLELIVGPPVWGLLMILAALEDEEDPKTKGELKP